MIKPDWNNSILNVSATLSGFLGNENDIPKIRSLQEVLDKGYRNVVYICFDGMGIYPLEQNLPEDSFLRRHIVGKITSVFPSTTTNATTTLHSATYPSQHGMFGWSLYFDSVGRCLDLYSFKDSYTGGRICSPDAEKYVSFNCFYDKGKGYNVTTVNPPYVKRQSGNIVYNDIDGLFVGVEQATCRAGKNFVFCYCGLPDSVMHDYGVTSAEARKIINTINNKVEQLADSLTDTVLIITPDHGQTDISGYIRLYEDKQLQDSVLTPSYLELRAAAFRVKDKDKFLDAVKKYEEDAMLFAVSDMVKENFFGPYTDRLKMLGDYILVMKDNEKQFVFSPEHMLFKGHHAALTEKEMLLPLIIVECRR